MLIESRIVIVGLIELMALLCYSSGGGLLPRSGRWVGLMRSIVPARSTSRLCIGVIGTRAAFGLCGASVWREDGGRDNQPLPL